MMSQSEFIGFVKTPRPQIYRNLGRFSVQGLLQLMRDLQMGLAAYAKAMPKDMEFQGEAVNLIRRIELTAFKNFTHYMKPKILNQYPELVKKERAQTLKWHINQAWSTVYKQVAY